MFSRSSGDSNEHPGMRLVGLTEFSAQQVHTLSCRSKEGWLTELREERPPGFTHVWPLSLRNRSLNPFCCPFIFKPHVKRLLRWAVLGGKQVAHSGGREGAQLCDTPSRLPFTTSGENVFPCPSKAAAVKETCSAHGPHGRACVSCCRTG